MKRKILLAFLLSVALYHSTAAQCTNVNQPADQAVCAGTATAAVSFSPTSYDTAKSWSVSWTNNNPATGLTASGLGDVPSFTATNTTNVPVTSTVTATPRFISGTSLALNQQMAASNGIVYPGFANTIFAQPFVPASSAVCGASVTHVSSITAGTTAVTNISLWDNLPTNGGHKLAEGSVSVGPNSAPVVLWNPVTVTPGNTYFILVSCSAAFGLKDAATSGSSIYFKTPSGSTFGQINNHSLTYKVYGAGTLTTCTGAPVSFAITANPVPSIATTTQTICSGNTISIPVSGPSGTIYSWTSSTAGTITGASSGSGTTVMQVLTNSGNSQGAAFYTIQATASNGCAAAPVNDTVKVNPLPPVPVISANSPICTKQMLNVSTPAIPGMSYYWSTPHYMGPGTGYGLLMADSSFGGAYTLTQTNTATGCSATATLNVIVKPLPAAPTAGSNSPVCNGQSIDLTASSATSGATYSWTGPNSFISAAQNPSIAPATVAMGGTYTVKALLNGCQSDMAGTVNVAVNATPVIYNSSFTNPTTCNGNNGSISLTGLTPSTYYTASYTKNGTAITTMPISTSPAGHFNIVNLSAGVYDNVTVSFVFGTCNSAAAGPFTLTDPAAPAAPAAGAGITICAGQTINLTTPAVSGMSYSWTGPNGFLSAAQNPSINNTTTAAAGIYSVKLTNTATGCASAAAATNVMVNALPATPAANSPGAICEGQDLNLTTTAAAGMSYSWTGPNGFISSAQNPAINNAALAASGTYSVTLTDTATGCASASGTASVVVNPLPATPAAGSNTPVCAGQTLNLSTPPASGMSYSWTGPNNFNSNLQNPALNNTVTTASGNYSLMLTNTVTGCTSAAVTTPVMIKPLPVKPVAGSGSPVCAGQQINLTAAASTSGATYSWTGPNNYTTTAQNPVISNSTAANTGAYIVFALLNGCQSAGDTINITVNPIPAATVTAIGATAICANDSATLQANTGAGLSYQWLFNTGNISNATAGICKASQAGSYAVTVTNTYGCNATSNPVSILVNPMPVSTVTYTTPTSFCDGGNIILSAAAGSSYAYQWSLDGTPINNAVNADNISYQTGDYRVAVTTALGCSAVSQPVHITVYPLPHPLVTKAGNLLTTQAGFTTYQWYYGGNPVPGETGTSIHPAQNGAYHVSVTDSNGCSSTSSPIYVNTLDIAATHAEVAIKVYPNPTHQVVFIDAPVAVHMQVRDLTGRIILVKEKVKKLDLGDIADGVYMLYITDEHGSLLKADKIFKN